MSSGLLFHKGKGRGQDLNWAYFGLKNLESSKFAVVGSTLGSMRHDYIFLDWRPTQNIYYHRTEVIHYSASNLALV